MFAWVKPWNRLVVAIWIRKQVNIDEKTKKESKISQISVFQHVYSTIPIDQF